MMLADPVHDLNDIASELVDHSDYAKRALCVGITYRHSLPPELQLHHTHDDAQAIRTLLRDHYGYKDEDIVLLLDDDNPVTGPEPTRENLMQAMRDLVAGAKWGDRFVFHYSGHGSQVEDESGDEDDHKDEVIWPSDVSLEDPSDFDSEIQGYILDDLTTWRPLDVVIQALLQIYLTITPTITPLLRVLQTDVVTLSQDVQLPLVSGVEEHISGVKEYEGASDGEDDLLSPLSPSSPTLIDGQGFGSLATVVSWSACKDPQETFECRKGGVFVYLLSHVLAQNPNITHEQLLHKLTQLLKECDDQRHADPTFRGRYGECKPPRPQLATLGSYHEVINTPMETNQNSVSSQAHDDRYEMRSLSDVVSGTFSTFNHRGLIIEPFDNEAKRDAVFQEKLSEMIIDLMLEFHAWSTSRPTYESDSTADKLEKEINAIMETEKEQGRSSAPPAHSSLVGRRTFYAAPARNLSPWVADI
ncbi:hypothetical protein NM688_g2054 [Phlebia brevispora]|uniref:Uncharacterized protein n=1 Tax=Phlebia brevispora TaxID=194682 RepID=A0ACC1T9L2_9APHY|nr:hypothetical protein NM688_g2054 [Phlebia brevispora]